MIAIFRPRNLRTVSGDALTISSPSTHISPDICALFRLYRPRTARLVTDLPDPDSPTMPSVFPRSRLYDRPSTDLTRPSSVGKWMHSSRTSRNARGLLPSAVGRITDVTTTSLAG